MLVVSFSGQICVLKKMVYMQTVEMRHNLMLGVVFLSGWMGPWVGGSMDG